MYVFLGEAVCVLGCGCLGFQYCSIDGFEATPESMLFDYLGITPYHGWISDVS